MSPIAGKRKVAEETGDTVGAMEGAFEAKDDGVNEGKDDGRDVVGGDVLGIDVGTSEGIAVGGKFGVEDVSSFLRPKTKPKIMPGIISRQQAQHTTRARMLCLVVSDMFVVLVVDEGDDEKPSLSLPPPSLTISSL